MSPNREVLLGVVFTVPMGGDHAIIVYGLPRLPVAAEPGFAEALVNSMQHLGSPVRHVYIGVGDEEGTMITAMFGHDCRPALDDQLVVHRVASDWVLGMLDE